MWGSILFFLFPLNCIILAAQPFVKNYYDLKAVHTFALASWQQVTDPKMAKYCQPGED